MNTTIRQTIHVRSRHRGMSLLFALLALAALSLAGVALVRSVNTSALVIGNLGFKQDATSASSRATEQAIQWLLTNAAILDADHAANGYYATALDTLDPTGRITTAANKLGLVNWDSDGCAYAVAGTFAGCTLLPSSPPLEANGNSSRYVIARLCQKAEAMSGTNPCAKPATATVSVSPQHGEIKVGKHNPDPVSISPYYRIIVRTVGARNPVSYTETIVHF